MFWGLVPYSTDPKQLYSSCNRMADMHCQVSWEGKLVLMVCKK